VRNVGYIGFEVYKQQEMRRIMDKWINGFFIYIRYYELIIFVLDVIRSMYYYPPLFPLNSK
jgi:hypothetical protein